jgi:hypothetical protein
MPCRLLALLTTLLLAVPLRAQVITPNQSITVIDSGTACVTAPAACAIYALDQTTGGVTINVFGTWTGTLTFEGTNNNGIWVALTLTTNVATGAQGSTTTANGLFAITNVGVILVRVRATAAITGTAQITAAKGLGFARAGSGTGAIGSVPALVAYGRSLAQTAAVASVVAYTVGGADGSFSVSGDITVTSFAAGSFQLTCSYTDESSSARVINVPLWRGNVYVISATAADVWLGSPFTIRAKAGTTITLATAGTFTTVTYNVEGLIYKLA